VSAELAARITAASALLADFYDFGAIELDGPWGAVWACRLARALGQVLDGIGEETQNSPGGGERCSPRRQDPPPGVTPGGNQQAGGR
jgi:hypothetical protein